MPDTNNRKMSVKQAFDEVFGKEDKYFGEWFIKSDESLSDFLESLDSKEIFFKQLRYLYLYLESLDVLKKQAVKKDWSIANVVSKETWYCCVLLLLIALIDQHTQHELNQKRKLKNQKSRFLAVMNKLSEAEKRNFVNHYNSNGRHKTFNQAVSHLYATRNFFAHEIVLPDDSIPQDGLLVFSDKKFTTMRLNMPYGHIFLNIVKALIRYLGYSDNLEITSNKKFDSWIDMFRET